MTNRVQATVPPAFSWGSQVVQYAEVKPEQVPGITYFPGPTPLGNVDCLLYYNEKSHLVGILNHYPFDMLPWESAGNVNIFIRPSHKRQGIATTLWREAVRRWDVRLDKQRFTEEGAEMVNHLIEKGTPL